MISRIFYAASGPGDLIESNERWKRGEHNPSEVSITFSGQIQDFCRDSNLVAYFVSTHARRQVIRDGPFTFEHRPKPAARGARYHWEEVRYGLGLLRTALRFRAEVALMDSGTTHYFVLSLFRLLGIKVVPILHNTLWPKGFPPTKPVARFVRSLDALFWRFIPATAVAVSPECERQVDEMAPKKTYRVHQTRAQFLPEYFASIPPPPGHERKPFCIMFIGRIDRIKGVFDILEIARRVEASHPHLVRWELCGTGRDFEELKRRHEELGLHETVIIHGWTSLEDLRSVYARSHAAIIPTRSSFQEGLAMTAAEAILAGRPIVTNPVVPALEILRSAAMAAKTDDPESHRLCVETLATDSESYERLQAACAPLQHQFYDRELGLAAVLKRALAVV